MSVGVGYRVRPRKSPRVNNELTLITPSSAIMWIVVVPSFLCGVTLAIFREGVDESKETKTCCCFYRIKKNGRVLCCRRGVEDRKLHNGT